MEAIWLMIGAALSTLSGVVFWFLNSRTTTQAQRRQHSHELEVQAQRLDAEREAARLRALREHKLARLQPLFDALERMESSINAKALASSPENRVRVKDFWNTIMDDDAFIKLPLVIASLASRIQDDEVREDVLEIGERSLHLEDDDNLKWLQNNLARVHAHLEVHTVGTD